MIKRFIQKLVGVDDYIALLTIYINENYRLRQTNEKLNRMLRKAYFRGIEYAKNEIKQQSQDLLNEICKENEIDIDDLIDVTGDTENETN